MIQCPVNSQPVQVKFSVLPTAYAGIPKRNGFALYYLNQGPAQIAMSVFKAAMDGVIAAAFAAAQSVKYTAPQITIRDMTQYFNPDVVFAPAVNAAYVGAVIGDALPWNVCANFEKQTALSGKMNRGQLFLPGVSELGNVQGGVETIVQAPLYQTLAAALAATIVAGGQNFVPQIFSPTLSNKLLGTLGIWMQPIIKFDLDLMYSNLKRRKWKNLYS